MSTRRARSSSPGREVLHHLYWVKNLSLREIGERFHVSPQTALLWMRKEHIERRPSAQQLKVKKVGLTSYKLCKGPLHRAGVWVKFEDFTKRPDGMPRSQCRACESHHKGAEQQVDFRGKYQGWLDSCVNRLGIVETARRLQMTQEQIWVLRSRPPLKIRRRTARKILHLLNELNKTGEVRHKDSIRHGATQRGREERQVVYWNDYYRPHGDQQTGTKRSSRKAS
jgi:hypothetical protein